MIGWENFEEFKDIETKYLPKHGDGVDMAQQIVAAFERLIYRHLNDGDTVDDPYGKGNNVSHSGNWLYNRIHLTELEELLDCTEDTERYREILYKAAKKCLNKEFLLPYVGQNKSGNVYNETDGPFSYNYEHYECEED